MLRRRVVVPLATSATTGVTVGVRRIIEDSTNYAPNMQYDPVRYGQTARDYQDQQESGYVEKAPRAVGDYEIKSPDEVIPGAHPLPLSNGNASAFQWPLVSPYMPSPQRVHPYFTEPIPELPHFQASVPIVYPPNVIKEPIVVPVFNIEDGTVSHTRTLCPYVFGQYPEQTALAGNAHYWIVRNQNYKSHWELGRQEIFRKGKKNWANTGTGMGRVSDRKNAIYPWGGRPKPNKPWNAMMPTVYPDEWHTACRMTLALKILQGKVQIVDRLTLPEPTTAAFKQLCERMHWDVRHTGAGALFMDGGSRLTPSDEFDPSFFYGSFINGRVKVVRPTITVDEPIDWNPKGEHRTWYRGPRGPKNPVPFNRFNTYDALDHHLLVMTEGAVVQLEQEMEAIKIASLPPHVRTAMAEAGLLEHALLGTVKSPLEPVQMEAAARTEEREKAMYAAYYDNPYEPWSDEALASYVVDDATGTIRRYVSAESGEAEAEAAAADAEKTKLGSWARII